ncbi:unnamed protein product [Zymoseptoria tritici ST99CH_1A5]|uniref:Uncharacterized protein n=1 Tax=Zymoseptoria tritici ST99CH_1A5 TaxID=1276529 RepID=A0A1Y6LB78_ZYMTR|nr:unnamed protein product [Zymoseptoria tritici ST99CH_1A5]
MGLNAAVPTPSPPAVRAHATAAELLEGPRTSTILAGVTTFANRRVTIASRWTTRGERRIVVSREGREGRGGREMGMLSVVERG